MSSWSGIALPRKGGGEGEGHKAGQPRDLVQIPGEKAQGHSADIHSPSAKLCSLDPCCLP